MMDVEQSLERLQREHEALMVQIERFALQLLNTEARETRAESLLALIGAISMHFGFEEALMEEGDYVDFPSHRRQHHSLLIELGLLLDRIEEANHRVQLARQADFIGEWYRRHVEQTDRALLDWLGSRR